MSEDAKVPWLVVLVEKDDTRKAWDYVFTQEDWTGKQNLIGNSKLWIHSSDSSSTTSMHTPSLQEKNDSITIGVIPSKEQVLKPIRVRRK